MTEGERFVIQIVQMAVNMSVTEKHDELGESLALRSAGKRTAAGVFDLVIAIRLYWQLIVKYHTTKAHIH